MLNSAVEFILMFLFNYDPLKLGQEPCYVDHRIGEFMYQQKYLNSPYSHVIQKCQVF